MKNAESAVGERRSFTQAQTSNISYFPSSPYAQTQPNFTMGVHGHISTPITPNAPSQYPSFNFVTDQPNQRNDTGHMFFEPSQITNYANISHVPSSPYTQTQPNFTTGVVSKTPTFGHMSASHLAPPRSNQSSLGKQYSRPQEYPTPEWEEIFETIRQTSNNHIQFVVTDISPVFVWDKKFITIKFSATTKTKFGIEKSKTGKIYNIVETGSGYGIKIESSHILWQKVKAQLKQHCGNEKYASLLERIGRNGVDKRVILSDGKGICTFKDGEKENIAVVDGNRIDVYNKDLEYQGSICRNIEGTPSGLSFHENYFLVTNQKYYSIIHQNREIFSEIKLKKEIPNQIAIHGHRSLHYFILLNSFVCNLGSMEDPLFLMLYRNTNGHATFSDFVVDDNRALIALTDQIIEYCINNEYQDANFVKFGELRSNQRPDNSFEDFYPEPEDKYSGPNTAQLHKIDSLKNLDTFIMEDKIFIKDKQPVQGLYSRTNYTLVSFKNSINSIYKERDGIYLNCHSNLLSRTPGKLTKIGCNIFTITSRNYDKTKEDSENENQQIPIHEGPKTEENLKDYEFTQPPGNNTLSSNNNGIDSDIQCDNEFIGAVKYLFSSVVLTCNFLNHLKNDVTIIQKKLQLFTGWVIQLASGDLQWSRIFFLCRLLNNFKYVYYLPNSECHISMNLEPISTKVVQKDFGSIVFINSETFEYSYEIEKPNQQYSIGIICENSEHTINLDQNNDDTQIQTNPICVFGSTLVQVYLPTKYKYVDKRGMFVIINNEADQNNHPEKEKTIGVGEIISFADLHRKDQNTYHLVGCCCLDKFSNLILYSCRNKSPLSFPIDVFSSLENICLVSMVTLPMKRHFLRAFLPIWGIELEYLQSKTNKDYDITGNLQDILKSIVKIFGNSNVYQM